MGVDPVSLAIIGASASVAGGGMGAFSQFMAGQQQRRAADYQAQLNDTRAGLAEQQGNIKQYQQDIRYGQMASGEKTGAAARGVLVGAGSEANIQSSMEQQHAMEKSIIAQQAGMQEWGYQTEAKEERYGGKMAARAGDMNAAGTMLGALGSAAMSGTMIGMNTPGGGTAGVGADISSAPVLSSPGSTNFELMPVFQ